MAATESWRVAIVSMVAPVIERLVPVLRDLGHEPRGVVTPRVERRRPDDALTDANIPAGLDLLFGKDRWSIEPLLRALEPDLMVCWGFPWKLPPAALEVARLGSINLHPALLPRHRGPIPLAWALREGDGRFGITWHRMDAELDTGRLLAQTSIPIEDDDVEIMDFGPKLGAAAFRLLPGVLERVAAGDPGDLQPEEGASWAGYFEDDEYARVDWLQPARRIHDQVRAWNLTFGMGRIVAPVAELDGERVRIVRTSLRDPGGGARLIECGDGLLWLVETEAIAEGL
ncbi:MAG: methionyl-tRNA formyltransferase [Actinobacteria bacterium]|nr:methionyl-tRNA formyltransferase [Actinomycetota bacterium]